MPLEALQLEEARQYTAVFSSTNQDDPQVLKRAVKYGTEN